MSVLLIISVLLPIAAGIAVPLLHFRRRILREIFVFSAVAATSVMVLALLIWRPESTLRLFDLDADLTIALGLDGLSGVFAGLVAVLWPLASVYAFEYIRHEGGDDRFFALYTASYGVTLGIAFSANFITLYLFYELLTLVTLPLVMHSGDNRSVRAGKKYLFYSIGGATCALMGLAILYISGNETLSFTYGGFTAAEAENETLMRVGYLLLFFGFGVKAAIFPFHGWLPSAGVAPTPVTALLHAVAVVKAGVFAIMRATFFGFDMDVIRGSFAQDTALLFAVITIVYGSAMALREQHVKRRLAYSTVSNLSYIVFGVALMTPQGLSAALLHMVFHGVMKITLFFCAGAVMYKTHREYVTELNGLGKKMPVTFAAFTVGSMALVGIPLLPGFLSKWGLAEAAISAGGTLPTLGVAALLISAMLTAAYLFTPVVKAFFPIESEAGEVDLHAEDPGLRMKAPLLILSMLMLLLGVGSSRLMELFASIAG